jgi:anion-transporting  ArsA/GET3 family ATPase
MEIQEFLAPKILIVSGKGGVGKTTVAGAMALMAVRNGRKVCVAEVDRKGTLAKLLGTSQLTYEPREILPNLYGLNIIPEESLAEYLKVQYHMKRISKIFLSTHFVDFITGAAPGLKDILVLGKIWYLEQNKGSGPHHDFDTIIVDAPAAGHMLTFLSAPIGLADAVRVGPVRRQSDWLVQMLRDPERCRVHFVSLAEEMPVTETLETAKVVEERLKISQGPLLANQIYSELLSDKEIRMIEEADDRLVEDVLLEARGVGLNLDGQELRALFKYAAFLNARREIQLSYLKLLKGKTEKPVIELPFLFSAGLAIPDIETLADVMEEKIEKI